MVRARAVLMGPGTSVLPAPDVAVSQYVGRLYTWWYGVCASTSPMRRRRGLAWCCQRQPSKAGHGGLSSGRVTSTSISSVDANELLWQAIATSASIHCQPSSMFRHPGVFFQWRGSVVAA